MIPSNQFLTKLHHSLQQGRPLLLDGALGTMLDNLGLISPDAPWSGVVSLYHAASLKDIHCQYIRAGAEVITTCTFRTSHTMFQRYGIHDDTWQKATQAAVQIAREAAQERAAAVAGSVGPLDECFAANNPLTITEAKALHMPLVELLADAAVDAIWLETFGHMNELQGAIQAAAEIHVQTETPFVVSVTTRKDGTLLDGTLLTTAMKIATDSGAEAFLVNCIPPTHIPAVLSVLSQCTVPYGLYANIGIPEESQDWTGNAFLLPEDYTAAAQDWISAGARLIGACCGSSPAHIAALHKMIHSSNWTPF